MNKSRFIVGDQYLYEGLIDRIYTYVSESCRKSVGIFTNCSGTDYHLRYENMTPCKKAEPKYPNPPRQHCEERIAFSRGANIEFSRAGVKWYNCERGKEPLWLPKNMYRVKLEKNEDDLRIEELEQRIRVNKADNTEYKREIDELTNCKLLGE